MNMQNYTKKEMIELLKKYKKQVSFRRLEDLAGIRHGCIGNFVYRGGKLTQERFRKIRRAWWGEMQAREVEKNNMALYPKYQPQKDIITEYLSDPTSSLMEDALRWHQRENEKRILKELTKDCVVVDLSPWYEKLWLKIKTFVAKLFMRKTK